MTIVVVPTAFTGATFGDLQTEFYARGFDYLNEDAAGRTRAKRWLNEAYTEDICDPWPWPFLETTQTGIAPLAAPDVKDVLYVADTTNGRRLPSTDIREAIDTSTDLTTVGTPGSYYWDADQLVTYPASSVGLSMRYLRVPAEMVATTDVPVVPARFRLLIVDGAVIRGYQDTDNFEAVSFLQTQFDKRLERMADALFSRNLDNSQYVQNLVDHD